MRIKHILIALMLCASVLLADPVPQPGATKAQGAKADAAYAQGKTVIVDSVYGNDGTGSRQTALPFLTPGAAKTAASSGDTIFARPGSYATTQLFKNGVNWSLAGSLTSTSNTVAVFDDSAAGANAAVSSDISGLDIAANGNGGLTEKGLCINVTNASSYVTARFRYLTYPAASVSGSTVFQSAGTLYADFNSVSGTTPFYWQNGVGIWRTKFLSGTDPGGTLAYANVQTDTPSGQWWVSAEQATGIGQGLLTTGNALQQSAAPTAEVYFINSRLLTSLEAIFCDGCKVYATTDGKLGTTGTGTSPTTGRIIHAIGIDAGVLWVTKQKVSGLILDASGGESHLTIPDWLDNLAGTDYTVRVSAGTHSIENANWKAVTSNGANISGGTASFKNSTLDFSAVAGSNPVTVSGGTTIVDNCTLKANGSRDCITGTGTVEIHGVLTINTTIGGGVTLTGTGVVLNSATGRLTVVGTYPFDVGPGGATYDTNNGNLSILSNVSVNGAAIQLNADGSGNIGSTTFGAGGDVGVSGELTFINGGPINNVTFTNCTIPWAQVTGEPNGITSAIQRIAYTGGVTAAASIAADSTHGIIAFLNGSTSSTTLTVTLPTGAYDGQTLDISYNAASATIAYAGATQIGGLTVGAIGSKQRFIWDLTNTEWR